MQRMSCTENWLNKLILNDTGEKDNYTKSTGYWILYTKVGHPGQNENVKIFQAKETKLKNKIHFTGMQECSGTYVCWN